MASNSDLKAHATSNVDFYALLGLEKTFSQQQLDSALRKTLFKYHPDKVGSDPTARDKFHLTNVAYEILNDASLRTIYDNAREARERRRRQDELLHGERLRMKQDLERREKAAGQKRGRDGEVDEQLEREIQRITEDAKRRRMEIKRKQEENEAQAKKAREEAEAQEEVLRDLRRSVKVKFVRSSESLGLDEAAIRSIFSAFGAIEAVRFLKDKRERVGDSKAKTTFGRLFILFRSVVGAYSAVHDWKKEKQSKQGDWEPIAEVSSAEGKETEKSKHGGSASDIAQSVPKPAAPASNVPKFSFTPKKPSPTLPAESGWDKQRRLLAEHNEARRQELERMEAEGAFDEED